MSYTNVIHRSFVTDHAKTDVFVLLWELLVRIFDTIKTNYSYWTKWRTKRVNVLLCHRE